jgi:hypothetical protein
MNNIDITKILIVIMTILLGLVLFLGVLSVDTKKSTDKKITTHRSNESPF